MKKLILFFVGIICYQTNFAQEHTLEINNNITPYHDATESMDGVNYSYLLNQEAWKNFQQKYPSWGARFNKYSQLPTRAFGTPIYFAAGANDPVAKAKAFLNSEFAGFKIPVDELVLTRNFNDGKYIHVDFKQVHNGKDILFSKLSVRFTKDLKIMMVDCRIHKNIQEISTEISSQQAISKAEQSLNATIINSEINKDLFLLPVPKSGFYELRPVYAVTVNTVDLNATPGQYLTYLDANNGEILYRENKVLNIGFKIKAPTYHINSFNPLDTLPLKNLKVTDGANTVYTDANGNVTTTTVNPSISLQGKFVKVVTGSNGNTVATANFTNVTNGDSILFPESNPNATLRHLNVYYHTNEIHDFMKTKLPSFTTMDNPLTARVDRTDGTCNAFYNGNSINFYIDSNGCNALSKIGDVMYHEYGHGITNKFWTSQGTSFDNGAVGEGYSDIWAISIIKNPIIGLGFYINQPTSTIRRYDVNPKKYPDNIVGEVHGDGEIIAGAWWDFAVNLSANMPLDNAIDTMSTIFSESHYGLANGPNGAEGQVFYDILIDALQYDDDDNDITNGTPHFSEIVKAFAKHGIYLFSNSSVTNNSPVFSQENSPINISATVVADFPALLESLKMVYRLKGTASIDTLALTKVGNNFSAAFPTSNSGDIFEYYFIYNDIYGNESGIYPVGSNFSTTALQRNLPYFLIIGFNKLLYAQNFESALDTAWKIGTFTNDNATSGKFIVANPISSTINGALVQTGNDHTSGTGKCAVTGNAVSAFSSATAQDVDLGRTSIVTEPIDLSGMTKPIISYWRWFSNSQGDEARKDIWRTWYAFNNGNGWSRWFPLERTYQPDVNWRQNIYLPSISFGSQWKLMFTATDTSESTFFTTNALVEAAVDDIEVYDLGSFPTGVLTVDELNINIFPNPTENDFVIASNEQGIAKIEILNTIGQEVFKKTVAYNGSETIHCEKFGKGIYFLKFEINHKTTTKRIVVK